MFIVIVVVINLNEDAQIDVTRCHDGWEREREDIETSRTCR